MSILGLFFVNAYSGYGSELNQIGGVRDQIYTLRFLASELMDNETFTWEGGMAQVRERLRDIDDRMMYTFNGLIYGNHSLDLPGGMDNDGVIVSNSDISIFQNYC